MSVVKKIRYTWSEICLALEKVGGGFSTLCDLFLCAVRYGASPSNYVNFDLKHANRSDRITFLTHRINERIMRKYNEPDFVYQFQNKYEFASVIGQAYGRKFYLSLSQNHC